MEIEALPRAAKVRASRAIENVHYAYHEKGGIRELETAIEEKRGAAAKHIYALAIFAFETARGREKAVALFAGMCSYAEASYKKQHEVENLKEALPTWSVFKSNILSGVRDFGLDPREYRSEGAFRVAKQKVEGPKAEVTSRPQATKPASHEQIDEFLVTTITQNTLRVLISQIIYELETLKRSKVKDAEGVLRDTMNALQPFVDARKAS